MALEIQNETIVGTVNDIHSMNGIGLHDNLQEKLNGELPIDRLELLYLINSWGRKTGFYTKDSQNKDIYIESCESTQSEQALLVRCNPIPFVEWISAKVRG